AFIPNLVVAEVMITRCHGDWTPMQCDELKIKNALCVSLSSSLSLTPSLSLLLSLSFPFSLSLGIYNTRCPLPDSSYPGVPRCVCVCVCVCGGWGVRGGGGVVVSVV